LIFAAGFCMYGEGVSGRGVIRRWLMVGLIAGIRMISGAGPEIPITPVTGW
jgi:hypothetical protein